MRGVLGYTWLIHAEIWMEPLELGFCMLCVLAMKTAGYNL
jgi:hypothetical protein